MIAIPFLFSSDDTPDATVSGCQDAMPVPGPGQIAAEFLLECNIRNP